MSKNVVVFGAGGYIGIPLCQALASAGYLVTAVDTFWFGKGPHEGEVHRLVKADTRTFDAKLLAGADAVIDLAGLSNDMTAEIDPRLTEEINVTGGKRLAVVASEAGVPRYVYSSSASVYGKLLRGGATEVDRVNPLTAYARSKVRVENTIRKLWNAQFSPVILRNATVFGVAPRMRFDLAVNRMVAGAWAYRVVTVDGTGTQWRPFIHISDVVRAFVEALKWPAGTYNVGGEKLNYRIVDLAKEIAEQSRSEVRHVGEGVDERSYRLSFNAVERLFKPKVTIGDGALEVFNALQSGRIDSADPTTITLSWYKWLIEEGTL